MYLVYYYLWSGGGNTLYGIAESLEKAEETVKKLESNSDVKGAFYEKSRKI